MGRVGGEEKYDQIAYMNKQIKKMQDRAGTFYFQARIYYLLLMYTITTREVCVFEELALF